MTESSNRSRPLRCQWCGAEVEWSGRGRVRKYCSQSCKQRAYEQRHDRGGSVIPDDAVILSKSQKDILLDSLFALRCSAEDIAQAAREEASAQEMSQLCDELVDMARSIEKLR